MRGRMGGEKIFFMKGKEEFSPRTKFVLWHKLTGDHRIVGENLYALKNCEMVQKERDTNL
jgi:hypothetical protein